MLQVNEIYILLAPRQLFEKISGFEMKNKMSYFFSLLIQIIKLPVANLHFNLDLNPDNVMSTYKFFTKPHTKYKIFKNKSIGVALVDLSKFGTREEYLKNINGRNHGAHFAKRAKSRGYIFREIDRNNYIDEIHEINTSLEIRQGSSLPASYLVKHNHYEPVKNFKYYGVLNSDGKLMAYCNIGFYGNFLAFSQLLGYRNNDGIMHLMVTEVICLFIKDNTIKYAMYDTFFGAQPGLKMFKTILGFKPYRSKYSIK